jgi:hypothetical protein
MRSPKFTPRIDSAARKRLYYFSIMYWRWRNIVAVTSLLGGCSENRSLPRPDANSDLPACRTD